MTSSVSVCIPTLNRPHILNRLLVNIHQHDCLPREILVIDASDDELTKQVCGDFEDFGLVKYIQSPIKQLTLQRNIAIQQSAGDYVLFLDDDIILESGCIKQLQTFLDKDLTGEYVAVGPIIVNEFGKKIYKYQKLYYKIGLYESLKPGTWLDCGDFIQNSFLPKAFDGIKVVSFLAAGTAMFRRKAITDISPDPNFRFGGEDKHWSLRLSKKYKLCICGSASLLHEHYPGGGRKRPIVQGRISMTNLYKILLDCDPKLTLRRELFFQVYTFIDLNRQLWSKLFLLRAKGYLWILGGFVGWFMNLCEIITGLDLSFTHSRKTRHYPHGI